MSKKLVNRILSAREEVTTSADGRWHGWTETELRLAEYAADLQAENASLYADLAVLSGAVRLIADTSGETRIWQIATGAMANISNDD